MILLMISLPFIFLLHAPKLIRQKHWRDLIVFSLFLLVAFILALLISLDIHVPNLFMMVWYLVQDVLHWNYIEHP